MLARMTTATEALGTWATAAPRTLAELEQQALVAAQGLGNALLTGVCELLAATKVVPEPAPPPPVYLRPPGDGEAPATRAGDDPAWADCPHAGVLLLSALPPGARTPGSPIGLPCGQHQCGAR